jgi:hypothetical protein
MPAAVIRLECPAHAAGVVVEQCSPDATGLNKQACVCALAFVAADLNCRRWNNNIRQHTTNGVSLSLFIQKGATASPISASILSR